MDLKAIGLNAFDESLKSVLPDVLVQSCLKRNGNELKVKEKQISLANNLYVIGFGKAVPGMAKAVNDLLSDHIKSGIICIPEGSKDVINLSSSFSVLEGAKNNMPDDNSVRNSLKVKHLVNSLSDNDILLVLISGGGSALLSLPVDEVGLADKLATIIAITKAGGDIKQLNTVRKALSQLKGGKLLKECNGKIVISLIISDIVGDPINYIASGPTVVDNSSPVECIQVFENLGIAHQVPNSVKLYLEKKLQENINEKISTNIVNHLNFVIGSNTILTEEFSKQISRYGYHPILLTNKLTGEASVVGNSFAKILCEISNPNEYTFVNDNSGIFSLFSKDELKYQKICLISSGETTVTVKGHGKGGRNQEMALSFLVRLQTLFNDSLFKLSYDFLFMSCGTDGQDGPTNANGAIVDQDLLKFVLLHKCDTKMFLLDNGSNDFFNSCDFLRSYLHITGLTGTNVMDAQILLVNKEC